MNRGVIRRRQSFRVVIPDAAILNEAASVDRLLAITRDIARKHPDTQALTIFAYQPGTNTESVASFGRVGVSRDALGWNGSGNLLTTNRQDSSMVEIHIANYDPKWQVVSSETMHLRPL